MSSKDFGLGPKWWQKPENKLLKCAERKSDWCDPTETDGCCAIIPCTYCLELEVYGDEIQYGTAEFLTNGWAGQVGSHQFVGYWERGYESGECEFVVELDGREVYRKNCYEGQSCRDSSDETEVTLGYDTGVLRWIKHLSRPLALVDDYETGCKTWFCGDCDCSCECLCVTLISYGGSYIRGEICDISYPCDAPVWSGMVGDHYLSVSLMRGEDGSCELAINFDGEEYSATATGCKYMFASISLPDGSELVLECKVCSCLPPVTPCCAPRCEPLYVGNDLQNYPGNCPNPLPLSLACDLTSTPTIGGYTCFNGSGVLVFKTAASIPSGTNCWDGIISGSCLDCNGNTFNWFFKIVLCCDPDIEEFVVSLVPQSGTICPATTLVSENVTVQACDPMLVTGCFPRFGACMVCFGDSPSFDVCFSIYETP